MQRVPQHKVAMGITWETLKWFWYDSNEMDVKFECHIKAALVLYFDMDDSIHTLVNDYSTDKQTAVVHTVHIKKHIGGRESQQEEHWIPVNMNINNPTMQDPNS